MEHHRGFPTGENRQLVTTQCCCTAGSSLFQEHPKSLHGSATSQGSQDPHHHHHHKRAASKAGQGPHGTRTPTLVRAGHCRDERAGLGLCQDSRQGARGDRSAQGALARSAQGALARQVLATVFPSTAFLGRGAELPEVTLVSAAQRSFSLHPAVTRFHLSRP